MPTFSYSQLPIKLIAKLKFIPYSKTLDNYC